MSLTELQSASTRDDQPSVCPTCLNRHVVTRPGRTRAEALRCPDCSDPCPICGGEGYSLTRDWTGSLVSTPCVCQDWDRRIHLFNQAGIPRRYALADLEATEDVNESVRAAKIACMNLTMGFEPGDPGLGLSGNVGTGKTHLLAAIARSLTLDNAVAVRFVEFTHLLSEIKRGYEQGKGEAEVLSHLVDAPVLIIDELGKGLATDWQTAILDELISKRYNRSVTTLFSTNYPFEVSGAPRARGDAFERVTLAQRVGSRMASRLAEMCAFRVVDAPDFRARLTPGAGRSLVR